MIENRAVGTNGDIHRRKHASQGKESENKLLFIVEKLIQICRSVGLRQSNSLFVGLSTINTCLIGGKSEEPELDFSYHCLYIAAYCGWHYHC